MFFKNVVSKFCTSAKLFVTISFGAHRLSSQKCLAMEKENQETKMKRPRSNTGRFSNKNNASNRLLAQQKLVEARRKRASSELSDCDSHLDITKQQIVCNMFIYLSNYTCENH